MWSAKAEGQSQGIPLSVEPRKTGDRSRITKGTPQQEALWAELVSSDRHVIVEARAGCLTGDLLVGINRAGIGSRKRLDYLVHMVNGGVNRSRRWDPNIPTFVRAPFHAEGVVRLARLVAAMKSGRKEVLEMCLGNGTSLRGTPDHLMLTPDGWKPLGDLTPGVSCVLVDDTDGKGPIGRGRSAFKRNYLSRDVPFHPHATARGQGRFSVPTHRLNVEAAMNGLDLETFVWRLRSSNEGLKFLDPDVLVHHRDHNHQNNGLDNLQVVTPTEHAWEHLPAILRNIEARLVPVLVVSLTPAGTEETFDLTVEDASAFTANGVAVHNCGKSASCREGQHRLVETGKKQAIRYAVYNKTAADEFRGACPSSVDVGTVHAFGYAALRAAFNSRVEKLKTYLVLDDSREGKNLPRYMRKSVAMLVAQAKNQGIPPHIGTKGTADHLNSLLELMEHFDINDYGRPDRIALMADNVLTKSAEWTEVVDFEDMIWLPSIHNTPFPPCDVLFLDEVQDWNPCQHALIPLLCRSGRVVAVGDPYQAIYAWRGADPDSMPRLATMLSGNGLTSLPLTLTFRCPKSHVRLANELVPDLEAYESNPEGIIDYRRETGAVLAAEPGDKVICTTNAPVIGAALKLIAARRQAVVKGRDVGHELTGILRGLSDTRTIGSLQRGVQDWLSREIRRLENLDGVDDLIESATDRAAGLSAVLSACSSPSEVEGAISELFVDEFSPDAVNFSTVHRAKGSEADHIWFLDIPSKRPPDKPVSSWLAQQQRNVRYVALTRSKNHLTIVQPDPMK